MLGTKMILTCVIQDSEHSDDKQMRLRADQLSVTAHGYKADCKNHVIGYNIETNMAYTVRSSLNRRRRLHVFDFKRIYKIRIDYYVCVTHEFTDTHKQPANQHPRPPHLRSLYWKNKLYKNETESRAICFATVKDYWCKYSMRVRLLQCA